MTDEGYVWVDGIKCTTAAPLVDIDRIIPYENNTKIHGSELEFLKNLLKNPEIGFRDPIEIDGDDIIVQGHGRRQAAIELGMTKVPCIKYTDMHGDASAAYRLAANRVGELAGYDFDLQKMEIDALEEKGWDMQQFSFEDMSMFDEPIDAGDGESGQMVEYITEDEPIEDQYEGGETYKLMVICHSPRERNEAVEAITELGYNVQTL